MLRITRLQVISQKSTSRHTVLTRVFCNKKDDPTLEEVTEKKKHELSSKENKNQALDKLNVLLKQMLNEDVARGEKLELSRPKPKNKNLKTSEDDGETVDRKTVKKPLVKAARELAESIGGDTKQTESELLLKLLTPAGSTNLIDIVKGMKIDRDVTSTEQSSRAEQVRNLLDKVKTTSVRAEAVPARERKFRRSTDRQQISKANREKIDLFGSEPFGLFNQNDPNLTEGTVTKTWKALYERELKLAVTHPPSNYFQEMIQWTEQGKIWKFPIDNEQGMEKEQSIDFSDHVFLEKHLETWCPPKGPLRHFMELVCVGLSKNPYLTVAAKIEHIEWYKDYFESKKKLLQEVGAFGEDKQKKQIQS